MKSERPGLLLIGHGASQGGGGPVRRLADILRAKDDFSEVATCFWKEQPYVRDALGGLAARQIVTVPVFATEGRIARELIPAEMGLTGALTQLPDGRQVRYLRPVGVHPGLAILAQKRALAAAVTAGFDEDKTGLLLIAHGNKHGGGARQSAEELASRIAKAGRWSSVRALFLEENPSAADWEKVSVESKLVVLPLLLAEGQHAARDLAPLFGLADVAKDRLVTAKCRGRDLACACGLADDKALAELILSMVRDELSGSSRR